jgi:hypothetical protein
MGSDWALHLSKVYGGRRHCIRHHFLWPHLACRDTLANLGLLMMLIGVRHSSRNFGEVENDHEVKM